LNKVPLWVGVLVPFLATFFGVLLSIGIAAWVKWRNDRRLFARMLRSVYVESKTNHDILQDVRRTATPHRGPTEEVLTDALQTTLSNPLFYRWAKGVLVETTQEVRKRSAQVNNDLFSHRIAAAGMRGFSDSHVEQLNDRAKSAQQTIRDMQQLIKDTLLYKICDEVPPLSEEQEVISPSK